MLSFFRVITFALQDLFRNFSLSFMTVLILVLMLLSVNTVVIVRVLTNEAVASIKEKIDVTVYFDYEVTEEEVTEVRGYVESFPEVTLIEYLSRDEVIEEFRGQYADNPSIVAPLEELDENPFGPKMVIKTRQPSDYQKIIDALSVPEYDTLIEAKTFSDTEKAIERIHTITTRVEKFSLMLSVIFIIIAFLIIFNTIRVAIYTQRVEIGIKKLVGATNWFVRGPYLVQSFLFSLLSTVIAYALVFLAVRRLDPYLGDIFGRMNILTDYFLFHILALAGLQGMAVLLLTIFSSLLAMRRHLKV